MLFFNNRSFGLVYLAFRYTLNTGHAGCKDLEFNNTLHEIMANLPLMDTMYHVLVASLIIIWIYL